MTASPSYDADFMKRAAGNRASAALMVTPDEPIPDVSPMLYRMRKAIPRRLPSPLVSWLAHSRARAVARWAGGGTPRPR